MDNEYQNAYNQAIRYLAIREHSQHELLEKLKNKGYSANTITKVIETLIGEDYQSDERFAEVLIRSRVEKRKGRLLIEKELYTHEVLEFSYMLEDIDFGAICKEVALKKYGTHAPQDTKEKQKRIRFLTSRGFSYAHISKIWS